MKKTDIKKTGDTTKGLEVHGLEVMIEEATKVIIEKNEESTTTDETEAEVTRNKNQLDMNKEKIPTSEAGVEVVLGHDRSEKAHEDPAEPKKDFPMISRKYQQTC